MIFGSWLRRGRFQLSVLSALKSSGSVLTGSSGSALTSTCFSSLSLHDGVRAGVDLLGYKSLTHVQREAFVPIAQGRDCTILGETGSGKSLAFLLPLLNRLMFQRDALTESAALGDGSSSREGLTAFSRTPIFIVTVNSQLCQQMVDMACSLDPKGKLVVQAMQAEKGAPRTSWTRIPADILASRKSAVLMRPTAVAWGLADLVIGTADRLLDDILTRSKGHLLPSTLVLDEYDSLVDDTSEAVAGLLHICKPQTKRQSCQVVVSAASIVKGGSVSSEAILSRRFGSSFLIMSPKFGTVPRKVETFDWVELSPRDLEDPLNAVSALVRSKLPDSTGIVKRRCVVFTQSKSDAYSLTDTLVSLGVRCALASSNSGKKSEANQELIKSRSDLNEAKGVPMGASAETAEASARPVASPGEWGDDINVMVCGPELGRGIDWQCVSMVINVGLPLNMIDFLHRSGRCARGHYEEDSSEAISGCVVTIYPPSDRATVSKLRAQLETRSDKLFSTFRLQAHRLALSAEESRSGSSRSRGNHSFKFRASGSRLAPLSGRYANRRPSFSGSHRSGEAAQSGERGRNRTSGDWAGREGASEQRPSHRGLKANRYEQGGSSRDSSQSASHGSLRDKVVESASLLGSSSKLMSSDERLKSAARSCAASILRGDLKSRAQLSEDLSSLSDAVAFAVDVSGESVVTHLLSGYRQLCSAIAVSAPGQNSIDLGSVTGALKSFQSVVNSSKASHHQRALGHMGRGHGFLLQEMYDQARQDYAKCLSVFGSKSCPEAARIGLWLCSLCMGDMRHAMDSVLHQSSADKSKSTCRSVLALISAVGFAGVPSKGKDDVVSGVSSCLSQNTEGWTFPGCVALLAETFLTSGSVSAGTEVSFATRKSAQEIVSLIEEALSRPFMQRESQRMLSLLLSTYKAGCLQILGSYEKSLKLYLYTLSQVDARAGQSSKRKSDLSSTTVAECLRRASVIGAARACVALRQWEFLVAVGTDDKGRLVVNECPELSRALAIAAFHLVVENSTQSLHKEWKVDALLALLDQELHTLKGTADATVISAVLAVLQAKNPADLREASLAVNAAREVVRGGQWHSMLDSCSKALEQAGTSLEAVSPSRRTQSSSMDNPIAKAFRCLMEGKHSELQHLSAVAPESVKGDSYVQLVLGVSAWTLMCSGDRRALDNASKFFGRSLQSNPKSYFACLGVAYCLAAKRKFKPAAEIVKALLECKCPTAKGEVITNILAGHLAVSDLLSENYTLGGSVLGADRLNGEASASNDSLSSKSDAALRVAAKHYETAKVLLERSDASQAIAFSAADRSSLLSCVIKSLTRVCFLRRRFDECLELLDSLPKLALQAASDPQLMFNRSVVLLNSANSILANSELNGKLSAVRKVLELLSSAKDILQSFSSKGPEAGLDQQYVSVVSSNLTYVLAALDRESRYEQQLVAEEKESSARVSEAERKRADNLELERVRREKELEAKRQALEELELESQAVAESFKATFSGAFTITQAESSSDSDVDSERTRPEGSAAGEEGDGTGVSAEKSVLDLPFIKAGKKKRRAPKLKKDREGKKQKKHRRRVESSPSSGRESPSSRASSPRSPVYDEDSADIAEPQYDETEAASGQGSSEQQHELEQDGSVAVPAGSDADIQRNIRSLKMMQSLFGDLIE